MTMSSDNKEEKFDNVLLALAQQHEEGVKDVSDSLSIYIKINCFINDKFYTQFLVFYAEKLIFSLEMVLVKLRKC